LKYLFDKLFIFADKKRLHCGKIFITKSHEHLCLLFPMFKHLIALFILVILFTISNGYALEVSDLYQAKIPVDSQASKQRSIALKKAMQAVILKVGGQEGIAKNDVMRIAIKKSHLYLTQYHYKEKDNQLFLIANFNENKVNQLFHQAKLAIWGSLRPQILLWVIDENGLSRRILSNSSDSALPSQAHSFSEERGLPLLLPLMDLDDNSHISLSDLWGRFVDPIRQASTRYSPEAIVVMRISNSSLLSYDNPDITADLSLGNKSGERLGQELGDELGKESDKQINGCGLLCNQDQTKKRYVLDWAFLSAKEELNQRNTFSQQYQGNDKARLLTLGLSDITDLIYQKYALSTSTNDKFVMEVANVKSLKHDSDLVNFLSELSAVKSVTLIEANGELRRFSLTLLGSPSAFLASLTLNKGLKPVNRFMDPLVGSDEQQVPVFYWEQQ
jgi:hypothetical protein